MARHPYPLTRAEIKFLSTIQVGDKLQLYTKHVTNSAAPKWHGHLVEVTRVRKRREPEDRFCIHCWHPKIAEESFGKAVAKEEFEYGWVDLQWVRKPWQSQQLPLFETVPSHFRETKDDKPTRPVRHR